MLNVAGIRELDMNTVSGSISLSYNRLILESPRLPISLSSGAGSVSMSISIPKNAGVTIGASTGFGTISQNLPGFSVTTSPGRLNATAGDLSGPNPSLEISLSTRAGTLSLESRLV